MTTQRTAIVSARDEAVEKSDLQALPLPPKNPLSYRQQLHAVRHFHTGFETLRDAGGPVTRLVLAPKWLMPPAVAVTSPQGARDVLGRTGAQIEKTRVHDEVRHLLGPNLFDMRHEAWLPRRRTLQPIFTKQHVRDFGGHMAQAADMVAGGWRDGSIVDLDTECRRLSLRALGRQPDPGRTAGAGADRRDRPRHRPFPDRRRNRR